MLQVTLSGHDGALTLKSATSPGLSFYAWSKLHARSYMRYLSRYVDAMHLLQPGYLGLGYNIIVLSTLQLCFGSARTPATFNKPGCRVVNGHGAKCIPKYI